jgi:NADPH:quinone reductase-like Zn-dependent oxidoreductase
VKDNFGVDHVINYRKTPDWAAEANRITHGRGADYIIENGGAGTIAQSIKACARGGMIAIIGFLASAKQEDMPDVASMVLDKGCIVRGVVVGSKQLLEDVIRFVSNKNIQPYIHKTLGFSREGVLEAFDLLKSARHIGKIGIEVASKK